MRLEEKVGISIGCLIAIGYLTFLGIIAFVIVHFILKYW